MIARPLALILAVLVSLVALGAEPAGAQSADDRAKAAAHFRQGQAYFAAGNFDRALSEYQAAFDLSAEPSLIFNIALCHVRMDRPEQALEAYRRYLELAPEGTVDEEAREEVARLVPIVDKLKADREAKLAADRAAEDKRRREAEWRAAWEKANAPPSRVPIVVMGAGAAIAAVGATFHVLSWRTRGDVQSAPDVDSYYADRDTFKTQRAVAIGAYAAGAVTILTGLVLRGTVFRRPEAPAPLVTVVPGGAAVMVGWSR